MTENSVAERRTDFSFLIGNGTFVFLFAGLPMASVYANRAAPTILAAALAMAVLYAAMQRRSAARLPANGLKVRLPLWTAWLLLAVSYAAATSLWSIDPPTSIGRSAKLLGLVSLGVATWILMPPLHEAWHRRIGLLAVAVAALVTAAELLGEGILRQFVYSRNPSDMNRTLVTLSLLVWPALALAPGNSERVLRFAAVALVLLAVALSRSVSAQTGLVVGGLAFLLATTNIRLALALLANSTIVAFAAMPAIVQIMHGVLHEPIRHLPVRTDPEVRLEIWELFSQTVWYKPFFGWGIEASRFFGHIDIGTYAPGLLWDSKAWHHPHNAVLQIWVELGAAGVLLAGIASTLLCLSIGRLPPERQPYACGLFGAAFVVALVGHGAWQSWWISLLSGAIIMIGVKDRSADFPGRADSPKTPPA